MAEPGSLGHLALDAIGKYFYELCIQMVPSEQNAIKPGSCSRLRWKNKMANQINTQNLKTVCRRFHELIVENIPVTLANVMTNKLLACLDSWMYEAGVYTISNCHLEELVKCVIHPAVTIIEPEVDLLDCSDIFPHKNFKTLMLVNTIMRNIYSLSNLKALHVNHPTRPFNLNGCELLPPQLEEFSGICNDEKLAIIVHSCKLMRCLNLYGLIKVTDDSVAVLLQMKYLEKLNIAHTSITSRGITTLLTGFMEKGNALSLKCLVFSKYTPEHLEILKNLPNLRISLKHDYCTFFLTVDNFTFSDLNKLRNLHGIETTSTLRDLNDFIRGIGNQLVFLEVVIEIVDVDDYNENVDAAEMLLIGNYCTSLQCLHISGCVYGFPSMEQNTRHPLPGFKTISCLKLEIESGEKSAGIHSPHKNFILFLISQCVNLKKLTVPVDTCFMSKYDLMSNIVQVGCMKNIEEVYFKLCCCECTLDEADEDDDVYDQNKDSEVVKMLISYCPNLRVVGGVPGLSRHHKHNTQRLTFISEAI